MNAYFTASIAGKKYHLDKYKKIIETLEAKGVKVQSHHILENTESAIRMETKEQRLAFQEQLEKWINTCDFMAVEASFPSISVGYEISLALHRGKPVIMLYYEGDPPSLFGHHTDEKLVCEKYSLDTLGAIIDDFLNYVKGTADLRFTFFITPAISSFLDHVAKKQKLPKSVYLRKLIEEDMKKPRQ